MIIHNAATAREFVTAWSEASPRRRALHFKIARDGQSLAAGMAYLRNDRKGENAHRAAMRVLHMAEREVLCSILGWSVECVATVAELWEEVGK